MIKETEYYFDNKKVEDKEFINLLVEHRGNYAQVIEALQAGLEVSVNGHKFKVIF